MQELWPWFRTALAVCTVLAVAHSIDANEGGAGVTFQMTSPSFENETEIPTRHTCEGEDSHPRSDGPGFPQERRASRSSLTTRTRVDPHAPKMTWVHWIALRHPADGRVGARGGSRSTVRCAGRAQRLEGHRIPRAVPPHRPAPLLPQALRARHASPRSRSARQGSARASHERAHSRAGDAHRHVREERRPPAQRS